MFKNSRVTSFLEIIGSDKSTLKQMWMWIISSFYSFSKLIVHYHLSSVGTGKVRCLLSWPLADFLAASTETRIF